MKYGATDIHPLALLLTVGMGVAMLMVRRDRAVLVFLAVACLVTHAQRVVIADLDFSMLRVMILFGWARVVARGETSNYRFQPIDGILASWLLLGVIAYIFGPRGSTASFIQGLGYSFDAAGAYFLFRVLLRDVGDVHLAMASFGTLCLILVGPMLLENITGTNLFSFLGGVPEYTRIRDGRLRCQASFSHPIMVGNFGASSAALLVALVITNPKQRVRYGAALLAAVVITILSNSSGAALALAACLLSWCAWPARRYLAVFRWGTLISLVVIHFVREKPVWHLIGRLSAIVGGTGWHRVTIINNFVENFHEWRFLGAATTAHWKRLGGSDITNQYVLEGVRGGLPRLISFVVMLFVAFRSVGRSRRIVRGFNHWSPNRRRNGEILVWATGACLTVHSIAFIGVSYFGQLQTIFYLQLAMIPSLAVALERVRRREHRAERSARAKPKRLPQPVPAATGLAELGQTAGEASPKTHP